MADNAPVDLKNCRMKTNRGGSPYESVMVEFDEREKTMTPFVDWVGLLGMRLQLRGKVLTEACKLIPKIGSELFRIFLKVQSFGRVTFP
jgi:hypothetical protein